MSLSANWLPLFKSTGKLLSASAGKVCLETADEQHVPHPAPIMPASLYIIETPATDWQKVTGPGDIVSHGFRARSTAEHSMHAARPQVQRWADTTLERQANMGHARYCFPSTQSCSEARLLQLALEH